MQIIQRLKGIINIILNKPILLVFDVTKKCNQNCIMCNIQNHKSNEMNISEIEILAKKLSKFGINEVYLQGGEPLIRKDIIKIIDIFIKNSIRPLIITNGELLTKDLLNEISKRKCNLAVSIDTFDIEKYTKLRGKNSLPKVLKNLSYAKNIKKNGIYSITSTITSFSTLDDLKKISKYANAIHFNHFVRPYNYNLDYAGKKIDELIPEPLKTKEIIEYFIKNDSKNNLLSKFIYKEELNYLNNGPKNSCDALKYSMVLNEDGKFSPCIERTNIKFNLEEFYIKKKENKILIKNCNKTTPCIYGCTRNTGFLVKNFNKIILKFFDIVKYL